MTTLEEFKYVTECWMKEHGKPMPSEEKMMELYESYCAKEKMEENSINPDDLEGNYRRDLSDLAPNNTKNNFDAIAGGDEAAQDQDAMDMALRSLQQQADLAGGRAAAEKDMFKDPDVTDMYAVDDTSANMKMAKAAIDQGDNVALDKDAMSMAYDNLEDRLAAIQERKAEIEEGLGIGMTIRQGKNAKSVKYPAKDDQLTRENSSTSITNKKGKNAKPSNLKKKVKSKKKK